tara:strand:- start:9518 stop:12028 length:2511 start_codon:yes stop_codon:yes gene_type:complete
MAGKTILPILNLQGGLNSSTNERDIRDDEYAVGENVDTGKVGRLKCLGNWTTEVEFAGTNSALAQWKLASNPAGYGIFYFRVDRDFTEGTTSVAPGIVNGNYLAIANPTDDAECQILFYVNPQISSSNRLVDVLMLNSANHSRSLDGIDYNFSADSYVNYLYVDGNLRVYDSNISAATPGIPVKWQWREKSVIYFKNPTDAINSGYWNNGITSDTDEKYGYMSSKQFIDAPTTKGVYITKVDNGRKDFVDSGGTDHPDASARVSLLINTVSGDGVDFIGWSGDDKETKQEYEFYASYVYEGGQESMATSIGTAELGGGTTNNTDIASNSCSFIPVIYEDGWNKRIVEIGIYYRVMSQDEEIKYHIGHFPLTSEKIDVPVNVCHRWTAGASADDGFAFLIGDKSGKGTTAPQDDTTTGSNGLKNVGKYCRVPPQIFTHATKSGIRGTATSIDCYYKTGVIVNRRLYVGNIKQKTKESPNALKHYGDRLLKSITNKFDVLPDTEFIDVAIRDGQNIIHLATYAGRLLQFKEETLYLINVSGDSEYLEGSFKNCGVRHPNAVVTTENGVFWCNDDGLWWFNGKSAPQNLIEPKVELSDWKSFIKDTSVIGYYKPERKIIVVDSNASGTVGDGVDMYAYNLLTQSFNTGRNSFGIDDSGDTDKVGKATNLIQYMDGSGKDQIVTYINRGTNNASDEKSKLIEYERVEDITNVGDSTKYFYFKSKEMSGGSPHNRKKIYKVYLTYKGLNVSDTDTYSTVKPSVKLRLLGQNSQDDTITLSPVNDFASAPNWKTAEFIPATNDKSKCANVYAVQIIVDGTTPINSNFEINDMSLVFRTKMAK